DQFSSRRLGDVVARWTAASTGGGRGTPLAPGCPGLQGGEQVMWGAGHRVALVLATLTVLLSVVPAAAWELQGEHRLLITQAADGPELRVAEALVLRHQEWWTELVVTQRLSPRWPARLEAEVSFWRTRGGWDYGVGLLSRVTERRLEPWVM